VERRSYLRPFRRLLSKCNILSLEATLIVLAFNYGWSAWIPETRCTAVPTVQRY
jgi:hypothetical protein